MIVKMKSKNILKISVITAYFLFVIISFVSGFKPGKDIGHTFIDFFIDMLKIVPPAFILIGLFKVWVKRETIEKHLGESSGFFGYLWALILAATTVGGAYVAFPLGYALYRKGAGLSVVLTYTGAAAICRVPMTIFEASFLGIKFTAVRYAVSVPLLVFASVLLGGYMERKGILKKG